MQAMKATFDALDVARAGVLTPAAGMREPAVTVPGFRLSLHADPAALGREWRAFQEHADCTVFQTHEWLSTWQRTIGAPAGTRPAIVAGRDAAGSLLFLFPLAIEASGGAPTLTWLGSTLNDYNAPLLAADFSRRFDATQFAALWRDVATLLCHNGMAFDVIRLEKMPARVGSQANPFIGLGVRANASGAYSTLLGPDWEAFYAEKRSATTRRRDRTKRKKLGELGEVSFVTPDAAALPSTLDRLFTQKSAAFVHMGVADIFARPGYRDFFSALATDTTTRQLVHVSRLDTGDIRAAVNLGLVFRDTYYHVLASYDGGEVARFGPGAAHLHELMRYAIDRHCTVFDFTIGDEPYKRDWCDTEIMLFDHVSAATARGWPRVAWSHGRSSIKRVIKQTPALWALYIRVRGALAALRGHG